MSSSFSSKKNYSERQPQDKKKETVAKIFGFSLSIRRKRGAIPRKRTPRVTASGQ
jgi:hypothetical protein